MIYAERETAHKIDRVDQMRCFDGIFEENRDEERRGEGTREPDRAYQKAHSSNKNTQLVECYH